MVSEAALSNHRDLGSPPSDTAAAHAWLMAFAAAVRAQNFDAGRALFHPDVISFGTRATIVVGIDALVQQQWRTVWDRTRGFDFEPAETQVCAIGEIAWAVAPWHSQGWAGNAGGHWFDRRGRASFVLARTNGHWLAVHSHFSMDPASVPLAVPPQTKSD